MAFPRIRTKTKSTSPEVIIENAIMLEQTARLSTQCQQRQQCTRVPAVSLRGHVPLNASKLGARCPGTAPWHWRSGPVSGFLKRTRIKVKSATGRRSPEISFVYSMPFQEGFWLFQVSVLMLKHLVFWPEDLDLWPFAKTKIQPRSTSQPTL